MLKQRAQNIRLLALDVDGILTDGRLFYGPEGELLKVFHTLDGQGLALLRSLDITLALISGRHCAALEQRANDLHIQYRYLGVHDKLAAFQDLLSQTQLVASQVAYMGDDLPDLPVLRRCGLAATVPNAPVIVQQHSHYITQKSGGSGAVREVCDLILNAQPAGDNLLKSYLA